MALTEYLSDDLQPSEDALYRHRHCRGLSHGKRGLFCNRKQDQNSDENARTHQAKYQVIFKIMQRSKSDYG